MDRKEICLSEGTVLKNRYKVVSVIGMGSFGIIYQAVDQLLDCYVAVKEFFSQAWADRNGESPQVRFPTEDKSRENIEACLQAVRHEADVLEVIRDVPHIARLKDRFEVLSMFHNIFDTLNAVITFVQRNALNSIEFRAFLMLLC